MSKTLTPMDNVQNVDEVRRAAIAFYDQEHGLSSEDRKQLYVFFEQQCRRMLLGFSFGVALGAAAPFVVRKKGSLVHPAFPVIGAVLGGTIVPGLINNSIYTLQIQQFNQKFGENSPICKTIKVTPDPLTKCVFWSAYFKKSSGDPNFRMKDPRTVVNSTKFFSVEENTKIPPYGKPGYYKSDDPNGPLTMNERYLSGWDKVRMQKTEQQQEQQQVQQQQQIQSEPVQEQENDIFKEAPRTIGDSYDSIFTPSGNTEQAKGSFSLDNDHLIQTQGSSGNSWDKIRSGSKP
jgi:hypothetical protein